MNKGVFFRSWTSSSVECDRTESMTGGRGGFWEASSFVGLAGMGNGVSADGGRSVEIILVILVPSVFNLYDQMVEAAKCGLEFFRLILCCLADDTLAGISPHQSETGRRISDFKQSTLLLTSLLPPTLQFLYSNHCLRLYLTLLLYLLRNSIRPSPHQPHYITHHR